jgi:2-amino-1-hydroxyethylphosphonate dioxygenase (glycine-forming)
MNRKTTIDATVDEIFGLYERFGSQDYIGEPVSQLEHMGQSARLAQEEGYDDEVILAAFFHDIGHLCASEDAEQMGGYGVMSHEKIGADYLMSKGFPARMARLVESHVQAKRYLTHTYPEYYDKLSEASKRTLEYQGGRMTAEEAAAFEQDELFPVFIRMRQWDELAKEEHQPLPDLKALKEMCRRYLMSLQAL